MKRIKLTHGTVRVSDDISEDTINALNKMTELAKTHYTKQFDIHGVVSSNLLK